MESEKGEKRETLQIKEMEKIVDNIGQHNDYIGFRSNI